MIFDIYRSSASKGVFDLICLTPGNNPTLGIQCKANGHISSFEKQRMLDTAEYRNVVPVLATKMDGKITFIDLSKNEVQNLGEYTENIRIYKNLSR